MESVLCIANQKGGVGKTTTAIHVAAGLAGNGKKTLLIDLDAQGNASSLFAESFDPETSAYSVFKDRRKIMDIALKTNRDQLYLLPAGIHLAEVETLLSGAVDGFFRLSEALEGHDFDWIVVDCPPNLGVLTVNAFVASTHLLIPLQTAKFSLDGLKSVLETKNTVNRRFNPALQTLGGLLTMYDPRTSVSKAVYDPISDFLHLLETKIRRSVVVEECHLMGKTLFEYQPRAKVAVEYGDLVREVAGAIEKG